MAGSRVRDVVNAAVDALNASPAVGAAYTHVPQNTNPPYIHVLGGLEVPWAVSLECASDGGDNGSRQVEVCLYCVSTYKGTAQVDQLADDVMTRLTDPAQWSGVAGFQLSEFVRNEKPQQVELNGEFWYLREVTMRVTVV